MQIEYAFGNMVFDAAENEPPKVSMRWEVPTRSCTRHREVNWSAAPVARAVRPFFLSSISLASFRRAPVTSSFLSTSAGAHELEDFGYERVRLCSCRRVASDRSSEYLDLPCTRNAGQALGPTYCTRGCCKHVTGPFFGFGTFPHL